MTETTTEPTAARPLAHPRLGFLGAGSIGHQRLNAILASGVAEVSAIAESAPQGLAAAIAGLPSVMRAEGLDELLQLGLDGIVIATPNAQHAEQAMRALDAGLPVFCQKPLARTAAETRQVIDSARRADRLLAVDLSYRFTEAMRVLRSVVQAGELGDIYAANVMFHSASGPSRPWARDARLAGGGCVIDLGIHVLDLALWTLGFPRITRVTSRLYASGEPLRAGQQDAAEDYAVAMLELDTGATISLSCSWNLPAGQDAVIEASFYGTAGGGAFRNIGGSVHDFQAELYRGTHRHALAAPPDDWTGRAFVEWAARVGAGERYDPWVEGLIDVAAAVDAVLGR